MLSLTPTMPLLLAIKPLDFRRGIDAISAVCQQQLQLDPFSGTVFIFTNKSQSAIKILIYDGTGFWLCLKRFSSGKLKWWPTTLENAKKIRSVELQILLNQGHPLQAQLSEEWRKIVPIKVDGS